MWIYIYIYIYIIDDDEMYGYVWYMLCYILYVLYIICVIYYTVLWSFYECVDVDNFMAFWSFYECMLIICDIVPLWMYCDLGWYHYPNGHKHKSS